MNLKIGRGKVVGLLGLKRLRQDNPDQDLERTAAAELRKRDRRDTDRNHQVAGHYLPDKNYFADWMTVKDIFDLFSDFLRGL